MEHLSSLWELAVHYAVPFVVVLSVVVFAHEFGHYWVARRCGVRVETFSIGFGREIFGFNDKHGTRWSVAWLPLGGYVKMFGDSDPASSAPSESVKTMTAEEKKVAFWHQSVSKRMAIVAAGPAANYIFAIVVLAAVFWVNGKPYTPPVVEKVMEASAAERAGIMPGDEILSIDGEKMESFEDIRRTIALNLGNKAVIELNRDGTEMAIEASPDVTRITDRLGGEHVSGRLGITSSAIEHRQLSPLEAIAQSFVETWNMTAGTLKGVGQMIMGTRGSEELGGPLRIAEMSGKVAKDGLDTIVWFMAVISINLGLINLFPIPLLDGGHLAFYLVEAARGKPLSERAQEYGARLGLALVLSLMLFATWNDLVHLRVVSYISGLFS